MCVKVKAKEVLVFDSSTFIREIGLTSGSASALKHYLYYRGTELVVPQVAAEEYERHLIEQATGKKKKIEELLSWLGHFCGEVKGWQGPSDDAIKGRAKLLANAEHLGATILSETAIILERAKTRNQAERPPSHKRQGQHLGLNDCRIWEQCLALLENHDVIFVSDDKDFCSIHKDNELHPQLQAEAEKVGAGRSLTFHPDMKSLLSELKAEKPSIPKESVFAFIYNELVDIKEFESDSGCRPTATGDVKKTLLTTDQPSVIEVRLEVDDKWESPNGTKVCNFRLHGSCHYSLEDKQFRSLAVSSINLSTIQSDGSVHPVGKSYVRGTALVHLGAPPIKPKPEILE